MILNFAKIDQETHKDKIYTSVFNIPNPIHFRTKSYSIYLEEISAKYRRALMSSVPPNIPGRIKVSYDYGGYDMNSETLVMKMTWVPDQVYNREKTYE